MNQTQPSTLKRLTPNPGEDQPAFAIRFHESMRRVIPETESRQLACMEAWDDHDGLRQLSDAKFPVETYQKHGLVCEFKEHVAQNKDKSSSHYGRDELAAMVRNMNRRIEETDNYGTLTDGHRDRLNPKPEVLGYRGPFYLGQLGRQTPRWAIFSVEHYTAANSLVVRARPTRSAEVWRAPQIKDRLIDPCAALGNETPRLDLGMETYARDGDDEFERYSTAAMPGACSAFVPTDKFATPNDEEPTMEGQNEALSPELVRQVSQIIQDVFLDTPQWGFLTNLMQGGEGQAADTTSEVAEDAGDGVAESASPEAPPEAPREDAPREVEQNAVPNEPMPEAAPAAPEAAPAAPEAAPADPAQRVQELEAENAALKSKLAEAGVAFNETYRRETLNKMRADGFSVDVDDELEMVNDLNDDQFERYAMRLSRTRTRIPMADSTDAAPDTPLGMADVTDGTAENMEVYAAQASKYVMKNRAATGQSSPEDFKNALKLAVAGRLPQ